MSFGIFVESFTFSNGETIKLEKDSIFVITGPNNSGKSTFLKEISRSFDRIGRKVPVTGPVLSDLKKRVYGDFAELKTYICEEFRYDEEEETVRFNDNSSYKIETIRKKFETGELLPYIEAELRADLNTRNRIDDSINSEAGRAARVLFSDEPKEIEISDLFRKSFGVDLILHRIPDKPSFYLAKRETLPSHEDRFKPSFLRQMKNKLFVANQGDGLRSFVRILLTLLYKIRTIVLIDEPEMFLHPPQIKQLAAAIASGLSKDTQVFVATHSEVFLRSIVNSAEGRLIVARITRTENMNNAYVLKPEAIKTFWQDSLLRTSDVLSALFHDIAIVCEGESDARFFQSMLDANPSVEHDPDLRFYHCGGKDRIPKVVRSLRAIGVPVATIVDLDVLSDKSKFRVLFESMGGNFADVEKQLQTISKSVEGRKVHLSGRIFAAECVSVAREVENNPIVPKGARDRLQELLRTIEPWRRVKEDGIRGLVDASSIKAFRELDIQAKKIGILINNEGELEGFCRDVPRSDKGAWLLSVLNRDLRNDPELELARKFITEVRKVLRMVISNGPGVSPAS